MENNWTEKLLNVIAWVGLIGGITFGTLVSKGIFESGREMCFPQAVVVFVGSVFASIAGWVILKQMVSISERLRKIESQK